MLLTPIVSHRIASNSVAATRGFTLGSSIFSPNYQLYIDGTKIENPKDIVTIGTDKPSFFGYTVSNVTINLTIQGTSIKRVTTSDKNGYWIYNLNEPLSVGPHYLLVSMNDGTKASTSAALAATFRVPTVLESNVRKIVVPAPSLKTLDYLTVSLLVGSGVFFLIFLYLLAKRHAYPHE